MRSEKSQKTNSSRRRLVAASATAVVLLAAAASVGVAWWHRDSGGVAHVATTSPSEPGSARRGAAVSSRALPLRGVPLPASTNLRLLVADAPAAFVLDVDRRSIEPLTGLPKDGERGIGVATVGSDALVASYRLCYPCWRGHGSYLVSRGSTIARRLGSMLEAIGSRDGEAVWTLSRKDGGPCTVRKVDLESRAHGRARQVRCGADLIAELPAGLLFSSVGPLGSDAHTALLEPSGRVVRVGGLGVQPVVGNLVLTGADRRSPLVLHDVGTGASQRLPWPSRRGYSLGEVSGDASGRFAIVRFARFSPEHRLDLWLLDSQTRRWQQLPGMPARVVPKAADVEWSPDGRVVILYGNVIGVWEPGSPQLAVGRVSTPDHPGGNFVVW
jgi:hypothetical protein